LNAESERTKAGGMRSAVNRNIALSLELLERGIHYQLTRVQLPDFSNP